MQRFLGVCHRWSGVDPVIQASNRVVTQRGVRRLTDRVMFEMARWDPGGSRGMAERARRCQ